MDVSMMNAAVFSISIVPVGRTVVMFAKPPSCFSVHDRTKHTFTVVMFAQTKTSVKSTSVGLLYNRCTCV